jgi:hypothetical protein
MERRGYARDSPVKIERVVSEDFFWYFDYELDDGELTLQVTWTSARGWSVSVWDFQLVDRRQRGPDRPDSHGARRSLGLDAAGSVPEVEPNVDGSDS